MHLSAALELPDGDLIVFHLQARGANHATTVPWRLELFGFKLGMLVMVAITFVFRDPFVIQLQARLAEHAPTVPRAYGIAQIFMRASPYEFYNVSDHTIIFLLDLGYTSCTNCSADICARVYLRLLRT